MSNISSRPVSHFVVGVCGHRWNKISASAGPRIARQLSSVFAEIEEAIRCEFKGISDRAPIFRLVSSLAEGVDQIAVSSRPPDWSLHAILPFPRARYVNDFAPANATGGVDRRPEFESALAQAASVVELPDENDAVLGYERAGEWMLRESDLLVAVWDGHPGAGRGGTQAVVSQAISAAVPVIWIRSDREEAPTVLLAAVGSNCFAEAAFISSNVIRRTVTSIVRGEWARRSSAPAGSRNL